MPVIDNLKRAVRPPTASAQCDDIATKLKAAEASLADLEAKRDAASLDALTDAPGAKDELARLNAASKEARSQIEMLQAAHRGALARKDEDSRRLRRDGIRHAYSRTKAHLKARDEAAAEFAALIEKAAAAHAKIYAADEAARRAWGIANVCEFPIEAFANNAIERAVAGEMWKHTPCTKGEVIPGLALPAAAFPALEYQNWPQGVPDIKAKFEANTAAILSVLSPKVPE